MGIGKVRVAGGGVERGKKKIKLLKWNQIKRRTSRFHHHHQHRRLVLLQMNFSKEKLFISSHFLSISRPEPMASNFQTIIWNWNGDLIEGLVSVPTFDCMSFSNNCASLVFKKILKIVSFKKSLYLHLCWPLKKKRRNVWNFSFSCCVCLLKNEE